MAWIAALLATVSMAGAALATVAFFRGCRLLKQGNDPTPFTVVVAADSEQGVPPELIRSTAVALHDAPMAIRLAHLPQDHSTEAALDNETRQVPDRDAETVSGTPPSRHFPDTWLASAAVTASSPTQWVFMDPCTRPSSHDLSPLSTALWDPAVALAAACPGPAVGHSGRPGRFMGRIAADLSPLLFGVFGGPGLSPAITTARPETVADALADPLTLNRPSLSSALSTSATRRSACLLPLPAACSTTGGGRTLADLVREHLLYLSRLAPVRYGLLAAWLVALPFALFTWILSESGTRECLVALASLVACLFSRTVLSSTWSLAMQGRGAAIAGFLLAPFRDILALVMVVRAGLAGNVRRGTRRFRMRRGGILSPVDEEEEG